MNQQGMTARQIVDELTYINYAHNRRISPHVTPERWAELFPNAQAMEARFQTELLQGPVVA